jgi:hypothetical protein
MLGRIVENAIQGVLVLGIIIGLIVGVVGSCAIPALVHHVRVEWHK